MSWNNIGNLGLIAIGGSMMAHHKMCKIDISNNQFDFSKDREGMVSMYSAMKRTLGGAENGMYESVRV